MLSITPFLTDNEGLVFLCTEIGHKYSECNAQQSRCINCQGNHRTLASVCPTRRDLIKNKSKDLRERSRSRSQANRQQQARFASYADAAGNQAAATPIINNNDMKDMIGKITTAIIYAQCTEAMTPGSFQKTIDTVFQMNNIPMIRFPTTQITKNIREMYKDMLGRMGDATGRGGEDERERESERRREAERERGREEERMRERENERKREAESERERKRN